MTKNFHEIETFLLGMGLLSFIGTTALAEETPSIPVQKQPAASGLPVGGRGIEDEPLQDMNGHVVSVNPKANQITLKTGWVASPKTLQVEMNTVIAEGNKRLKLSDLNVGDHVAVRYVRSADGEEVARSIAIQKKGKKETRG